MNKLVLIASLVVSAPAIACQRHGFVEIDCPTRTHSKATVNVYEQMRGHIDPNQEARLSASAAEREAATLAKRQSDTERLRAEADKSRADAFNRWAAGSAEKDSAAASMYNRMYRPRPFQSGY